MHYINTLKQELSGTKAYKETSEEEKSVVNGHCNHLALKFSVCVKERQDRLPTMYWLPKWSCQNVCEALIYLLDNIYIRFGTKLYRQIVGIPMGTNCAPLVADLFLFCYERDFMASLSDVKQAEIIGAFKSTSRYLDDLLNIDNPYFEGMVNRIYPPELQ